MSRGESRKRRMSTRILLGNDSSGGRIAIDDDDDDDDDDDNDNDEEEAGAGPGAEEISFF